ncbi:non-specific lipid-transfer protein-like protein At5g64080 [Sesamum indicum]|uniref:Non-specific lipid-transfer protein-like protein At5g64080 n=1 Tax=Sesamum indicum TaxID=4182 RepID=A0A6I9SX93_SESIN|nr:non-specific lipid-transfer protein-like protein At5g64080 [Sesamum indicum]
MKFFNIVACIIAMWAAVAATSCGAQSQPPAGGPSPALDCSTLIYDMIDCMPFLSNGGHQTKPDESCCSGLRAVVETDADCICYAVNSAAGLGLDINMTRAEALPSRCGVFTPPIDACIMSSTPGASPANPPKAIGAPSHSPNLPPTAQPPVAVAAAPFAPARAPVSQAPAPSYESSGAYAISAIFSIIFTIILFLVL